MKRALLVISLLLSGLAVQAQAVFSTMEAEPKWTFGVRAGVNLPWMQVIDRKNRGMRVGYHAGLVADYGIIKSIHLKTGVLVSQKGFSDTPTTRRDGAIVSYKRKGTPLYIEVPVLGSYRYSMSRHMQFQADLGPYLAYGIGGKLDVTFDDGVGNRSPDYFGSESSYRRFDVGVQVGAGLKVSHLYLGVAFQGGLFNINRGTSKLFNNNLMFSLGADI